MFGQFTLPTDYPEGYDFTYEGSLYTDDTKVTTLSAGVISNPLLLAGLGIFLVSLILQKKKSRRGKKMKSSAKFYRRR